MNNCGFFKRLLVIIYDGMLLAGVVLVAYVPLFALLQLVPQELATGMIASVIKVVYLIGISFFFYGWFWTHGGQTLGMRAWHLYLIDSKGKFPGWGVSAIRYFAALCSWGLVAGLLYLANVEFWYISVGLGYSWVLLNRARLAWHDILSNTRIVRVLPKDKNTGLK